MVALRRTASVVVALTGLAGLAGPLSSAATARPSATAQSSAPVRASAPPRASGPLACPPDGRAVGFSDALDKLTRHRAVLGGLSDIAWDRRAHAYASTVDNHGADPARVWFYRHPLHPRSARDPLVLRRADGTPYTGLDADDEGLAVLPGGRYLVSSETDPAIRVFGRHGRQQGRLHVPRRFRVAPGGQAMENATLEGLTISPSGRRVVASMEGTLGADTTGGVATYRRFLVYDRRAGGRFRLAKQVGYRVGERMRVAEVQAYGDDRLLVLEAAFNPATGNTIRLYGVRGLGRARDVTSVANLSQTPQRVVRKRLVADVTACPTLGAPADEPQVNPLMDNYEGMTIGRPGAGGRARVTLVSDDNFRAAQRTRLLTLSVRLP